MSSTEVGSLIIPTIEIRGERYGAVKCVVSMGTAPLDAVAVIAEHQRWCSTPNDCVEWLSNRGLTEEEARNLVMNARHPPEEGDLRVWWVPQVPIDTSAFHVYVRDIHEAKRVLDMLARYDEYQLATNVKPDYTNAGGLQICEILDGAAEWVDWYSFDGEELDDLELDDYPPDPLEQLEGTEIVVVVEGGDLDRIGDTIWPNPLQTVPGLHVRLEDAEPE